MIFLFSRAFPKLRLGRAFHNSANAPAASLTETSSQSSVVSVRSSGRFALFHALTLFIILISFAACNKSSKNQSAPEQTIPSETSTFSSTDKIDLDLTKMSSTMIYSFIFQMIIDPDSYQNKIIKVNGYYNAFFDESGKQYNAVIIPDATACCKQGIEFIWKGDHNYPQDYPEQNQQITICGRYKVTTIENDLSYSYLEVLQLDF